MNILRSQKRWLNILAATSIGLLLSGCWSHEKSEFMLGCNSQVRSNAICSCAWDKITDKYPNDFIKAMNAGRARPPADFQRFLASSMQQCMKER